MVYVFGKLDKKGRLLLPKGMREKVGLEEEVSIEDEQDRIVLRPLKKIEDPLKFLASFKLKMTKKTLAEEKHEIERQLFGR